MRYANGPGGWFMRCGTARPVNVIVQGGIAEGHEAYDKTTG
jgi:hypothetical protein